MAVVAVVMVVAGAAEVGWLGEAVAVVAVAVAMVMVLASVTGGGSGDTGVRGVSSVGNRSMFSNSMQVSKSFDQVKSISQRVEPKFLRSLLKTKASRNACFMTCKVFQ